MNAPATEKPKPPTLLGIADDMIALDALLAEMGGDVSYDEIAEYIDKLFAENETAFEQKADGYAALIRETEARAKARGDEADRMNTLARADQSKANFLRGRLKSVLELRGIAKIETDRCKIAIVNNGGKPRLNLPLDLDAIPAEYVTTVTPDPVTKVDGEAIRKAIGEGKTVDGCSIAPRGTRLKIT